MAGGRGRLVVIRRIDRAADQIAGHFHAQLGQIPQHANPLLTAGDERIGRIGVVAKGRRA